MKQYYLMIIQSFFNEDSDNVPFYSDEIGIPSVGRNDINLDDEYFN